MGTHQTRSAGVPTDRVGATAVHAEDERLVLDRPGLQEREPVLGASGRPQGDHDEQCCALVEPQPEHLREPEVVADERTDPVPGPVDHHNLGAGPIGGALVGGAEGVDLGVAGKGFARRSNGQRLVVQVTGAVPDGAPDHECPRLSGEVRQQQRVLPSGSGSRPPGLHAESGGKELGQDQQPASKTLQSGSEGADPFVVGGTILPRDVHLKGRDVHVGGFRRRNWRSRSPRVPGS